MAWCVCARMQNGSHCTVASFMILPSSHFSLQLRPGACARKRGIDCVLWRRRQREAPAQLAAAGGGGQLPGCVVLYSFGRDAVCCLAAQPMAAWAGRQLFGCVPLNLQTDANNVAPASWTLVSGCGRVIMYAVNSATEFSRSLLCHLTPCRTAQGLSKLLSPPESCHCS